MDPAQRRFMTYIKDKGACSGVEFRDRNNRLWLSPAMNSLVNGGGFHRGARVGHPPRVHVRTVHVSRRPTNCVHGAELRVYPRYLVIIAVDSGDVEMFNVVKQLCRTDAIKDNFSMLVPVYVVNPLAFQGYLNWRWAHSQGAKLGRR